MLAILVSTGIGDFLKNSFLAWTGLYFVLFGALVFILGDVFSKNHLLNFLCFLDFLIIVYYPVTDRFTGVNSGPKFPTTLRKKSRTWVIIRHCNLLDFLRIN